MSERTEQDGKRQGDVFELTATWLRRAIESGALEGYYRNDAERALRGLARLNKRYGNNIEAIWNPESYNQADRSTFNAIGSVLFGLRWEHDTIRKELSPIIQGFLAAAQTNYSRWPFTVE